MDGGAGKASELGRSPKDSNERIAGQERSYFIFIYTAPAINAVSNKVGKENAIKNLHTGTVEIEL